MSLSRRLQHLERRHRPDPMEDARTEALNAALNRELEQHDQDGTIRAAIESAATPEAFAGIVCDFLERTGGQRRVLPTRGMSNPGAPFVSGPRFATMHANYARTLENTP